MTIDTSAWKTYEFGDIASNLTTAIKDPLSEGLERFVGLEHIKPENVHINSWGNVADGTTFTRSFRKGQVLFGKRRAYQRKAALAEFDGICSGDILVFEANEENVIPDLLPFVVMSDKFFDYAIKTSAGSLSPRTKFKDLSKLKFKLPPVVEQKPLADLLWSVDEAIQNYEFALNALKGFKKAIIDRDLFDKKGNYFKLSEVGDVIRGVSFNPKDLIVGADSQKTMILRANNIKDDVINYENIIYVKSEKVKKDQLLREGDFAICMSSGSKLLLGKAAEYQRKRKDDIAVGAFCSILRIDDDKDHFDLIKYFFQSNYYRKQVGLLLSGSNINNLKKSDIFDLSVPHIIGKEGSIKKLIDIDEKETKFDLLIENSSFIKKQLINQIFG